MKVLKAIVTFVQTKTVSITAAVQALIGLLIGFEVVTVTPTQIGLIETALAAFLGLFVTGTVTANIRLNGGKVWGGYDGKSPEEP